mgnify:CR=1 FL=1
MKMYFKNWIFALAGALAMTACSNEMEEQLAEGSGNSGQEVKFTVGIENLSRTTIADGTLVTSFEPNDEIGIFAYDGGKLVSSNVKYTYNGSGWTSDAAIAAQDGVKLSYYAYYPYDASVTDPASIKDTVSADQTAGFGKNDMLSARNTEAAAGATNISLKFAHAMAMVQVSLMEGTTSDANATVTLQSILPVTSVNAKDGSVTAASGASVGVAMKKAAESLTYRAVVPEQTITAGSKLLTIVAGGKTFDVTFSKNVSYERGKLLQIKVEALNGLPEGATVTISGEAIDGWIPGEEPEGGETEEIPLIQPITSLAPWTGDTREFKEEAWFSLVKDDTEKARAKFEVVDDESRGWKKAAKLTYNVNSESVDNSWFKAAIGYSHISPMVVTDEIYIYKVTAWVKGEACDDASTASKIVFTCKARSSDRYNWSFAVATNAETAMSPNGTTVNKTLAIDKWEKFEFYINFKKVSSSIVGSGIDGIPDDNGNVKKFEDAVPADYYGFDLRVYTNNKGKKPVIYISDVTMEPYQGQ